MLCHFNAAPGLDVQTCIRTARHRYRHIDRHTYIHTYRHTGYRQSYISKRANADASVLLHRSSRALKPGQHFSPYQSTSKLDEFNLDAILRENAAQQSKKRGRRDNHPLPNMFMYNSQGNVPSTNFDGNQPDALPFGRQPQVLFSSSNNRDEVSHREPQKAMGESSKQLMTHVAPWKLPSNPKHHSSEPLPSSFLNEAKRAEHDMVAEQDRHALSDMGEKHEPMGLEGLEGLGSPTDSPSASPLKTRKKLRFQTRLSQVRTLFTLSHSWQGLPCCLYISSPYTRIPLSSNIASTGNVICDMYT